MASKVVKIVEADLEKLKSQKRGISTRYTNLWTRTTELIEYLDDYVIPTLQTSRKKQCRQAVDRVRKLL